MPYEGGSFQHNLRTVVLDPQQRVFKHFEGNTWKASELAQALAEAAKIGISTKTTTLGTTN